MLRLIVYIVGFCLGYDLMLLPNVMNDEIGIFKSISPIIGYQKLENDRDTIIARIIIILLIVLSFVVCFFFMEYVYIVLDWIIGIYDSILGWGYDKMSYYHSSSNGLSSYTAKHREYMRDMKDI